MRLDTDWVSEFMLINDLSQTDGKQLDRKGRMLIGFLNCMPTTCIVADGMLSKTHKLMDRYMYAGRSDWEE